MPSPTAILSLLHKGGRSVDRFWYAPLPAARLALLRVATGIFAIVFFAIRGPNLVSVARFESSHFDPVGPIAWLAAPLPPGVVYGLMALTVAAAFPFLLGFHYRISGPFFALLLLWATSYRSSWGMKFHTENLFTLHVLVLAVAPSADVLALGAAKAPPATLVHGRYGWPIRALSAITVLTYLLAGAAKLRNGGWDWVTGEVLRTQIAYDNLRKIELGSVHSPLGAGLVSYAWCFPPLAVLTLLVELGAPLALFQRRLATYWAAAAWFFHLGVAVTMTIVFLYPLSTVAYLSFFELERLLDNPGFGARLRRARARPAEDT